jgi:hypothetical protein
MQTIARPFSKLAVFGAAALFGASAAMADLTDMVFRVTATNAEGTAVYEATQSSGYWDTEQQTYTWSLPGDVEMRDAQGDLIARLLASDGSTTSGVFYRNDPEINMGFAVQAGASTTNFVLDSGLLSFPTINSAIGQASAVYTVTDVLPGGVTLTGQGPDGGGYLAQYNGFVPGGSDFTEQIASVSAPSGGSNNASFNDPGIGYRPVGGNAFDMSVRAAFSLTAFDLASGTSNYEILPEPTTFLLVLPVAAIVLRRRR